MYTKKSSQPKSSLLDLVSFHAACFVSPLSFDVLKGELEEKDLKIILDKNEDRKNYLKEHVEILRRFVLLKSNTKKYFLTNLNIRNTDLQNMLLKVIEEAGDDVVIIFVIDNKSILLDTFKSRVQVIELEKEEQLIDIKINQEKKKKNFKEVENLLKLKAIAEVGNVSDKQLADYLAI